MSVIHTCGDTIMFCAHFQRKNEIATGSPCPVCRDEYLVLDHKVNQNDEWFIHIIAVLNSCFRGGGDGGYVSCLFLFSCYHHLWF